MKDVYKSPQLGPATRLVTTGRSHNIHGMVNPPVCRASTFLYPDAASFADMHSQPWIYGRLGTPTSCAVEEAIADLEGGYRTKMTPSGLSASTSVLMAFLKPGDHVLVVDSVYGYVRAFCDKFLSTIGIETTYFDPAIGGGIVELIRSNTKMVYCESPGSQTMELQDIPAIAAAAHQKGAVVAIDNTWSGGLFFNAIAAGCDISIQAATKYLVGHSDAMLGAVTVNREHWETYINAYEQLGLFAGPDDNYLALRGIRTLLVRLQRHMESALRVAEWLSQRDEVETVLYPALPGAPGHEIWKRDFSGASGLFTVGLKTQDMTAVRSMLDNLDLFGMGFSWGGFESLAMAITPQRTASRVPFSGIGLRLHIGLEDPADLIADLEGALVRLTT